MKTRYALATVLATGLAVVIATDSAFGRGGRGGGGGFGGGGGGGRVGGGGGGGFSGGGRPSGGFSGGAPGGGFSGGARPNVGSAPSFNRPSAPAARPNPGFGGGPGVGSRPNVGGGQIGGGNRPSLQPGNRPNIGGGPSIGNRPGTLPGSGIGQGQGIGGIGNRPGVGGGIGPGNGIGNRPGPGGGFGPGNGIGNRPGPGGGFGPGNGIANRPGQGLPGNRLPGLGDAGIGSRLPNQGARVQDRMANRDLSVADRRSNLQDRMATGRQDWQQNRQGRQDDRQDWRDQNREDWQNWADDKMNNYGDWYHGSWYPGAGWGYMWDNYPVAAAVGMTAWGINRIGYGWGYYGYDNPYYADSSSGYDYSEPLVVYSDTPSAGTEVASGTPATAALSTDPGMSAFDAARASFYSGDYQTALAQLDITLKTMPNDAVVHEFRSLVLFALQKYPESAAAIYAVLAAGPGWDWTTMSSLYPSVDTYSNQLRALENFVRANPQSPDGRFLVGYHYMTNGYADAANKQFKLAQGLLPNDKLLGQLVAMTTPSDPSKPVAAAAPAQPPAGTALKADQFVGAWKASSQGSDFQLDLGKDGSFIWTYMKGKRKQSVKGVYAVDQNNLALETDDGGGTMLAQVDFSNPSQFSFKMVGDKPTDPGLEFKRS